MATRLRLTVVDGKPVWEERRSIAGAFHERGGEGSAIAWASVKPLRLLGDEHPSAGR
jgi:hypothetical protein